MVTKPFIGQLDRKVTIKQKVNQRDDVGGYQTSFTPLASSFAKMEEVSGKEDEEGKLIHLIDRKYFVRYRSEYKENRTNLILEDDGQMYEVIHVLEHGRKAFLEFRVKRYE